jgi:hypothetical protein
MNQAKVNQKYSNGFSKFKRALTSKLPKAHFSSTC